MALVDPLLSSPPAGQTSFISFSQQVARARTTCMKDLVTVRLRQESGAAMTFWGEKESTIVDVLNEFTPTALENASPVNSFMEYWLRLMRCWAAFLWIATIFCL